MQHVSFVDALAEYLEHRTQIACEHAIIRLADFLYLVRSSLAHGEMTPEGANRTQSRLDASICDRVAPVLRDIINRLLGHPDHKWVQINDAEIIEGHIPIWRNLLGDRFPCRVHGHLKGSKFRYFEWNTEAEELEGLLLYCPGLEVSWRRLQKIASADFQVGYVVVAVDGRHHVASCFFKSNYDLDES
jgi:hypothetical protein